jgi:outer membrane protein
MKRAQNIINAILILAVAGLFILYFLDTQTSVSTSGEAKKSDPAGSEVSIAFVKIDTILNNYDMFYDMRQTLEEKQKASEAELASKTRAYERGVKDFQNKVQKGLVTRSTAQQMEQELMQEQQEILQLRDQLTYQLSEEEQVMNRKLINEITEFLEEYNKDKNYKYIFSDQLYGDNILYASDSLDITNVVLEGLNKRYQKNAEKSE